jgi:hypothetical protein
VKHVVDHSISPKLTAAIALLADHLDGDEVQHRRVEYAQNTLDPVWLKDLGEREPDVIVVTADPHITRGPHEQAAWLASGLTIFFLRSFADLSLGQQAANLVKWWPAIVKEARRARKGSGYLVRVNGKIEKLKP